MFTNRVVSVISLGASAQLYSNQCALYLGWKDKRDSRGGARELVKVWQLMFRLFSTFSQTDCRLVARCVHFRSLLPKRKGALCQSGHWPLVRSQCRQLCIESVQNEHYTVCYTLHCIFAENSTHSVGHNLQKCSGWSFINKRFHTLANGTTRL